MYLTQQLEFLGFTINSEKMTIALPPPQVEVIQKEAARLLEMESVQIDISITYWDSSSNQTSSPIGSTALPILAICEITSPESSDHHLSILDPLVPGSTERFDVVGN